jgi:sulfoxide reductase heme-binding subunit YedZ
MIGFAALTGLAVLAATSTNASVKRLGKRWKVLHRFIFPITVLGLLHFFMQSKIDVSSATLYAGFFLVLATWRTLPRRLSASPLTILALALLGGVLTAEIEAGWFAIATHIDPARVLRAELVFRFGPRPAMRVLFTGLAIAAVSAALWTARRLRGRQDSQHSSPRKRHVAGLS